jgi:dolichol kinase
MEHYEEFGRIKTYLNKKKNIEGNIAGFIAGSLSAMLFVPPLIAFIGGLF